MKRKIVTIILILVLLIAIYRIYKLTIGAPIVGEIRGPEFEYITVNGDLYKFDNTNDYTGKNRGRFIGLAKQGDVTFRIYTVKGTQEYIFTLWDYKGEFYKKVQ